MALRPGAGHEALVRAAALEDFEAVMARGSPPWGLNILDILDILHRALPSITACTESGIAKNVSCAA